MMFGLRTPQLLRKNNPSIANTAKWGNSNFFMDFTGLSVRGQRYQKRAKKVFNGIWGSGPV
jgi:hypothetical protein